MNPFDFAHSPGAFSSALGCNGKVAMYTPFQEFAYTGSAVLPVFPDKRPKTPPDPMV